MPVYSWLLKKWARRADVSITVWGEFDVLRFGKGGGRGESRGPRPAVPYSVPVWVKRRIAQQRARLDEEARLKRYG